MNAEIFAALAQLEKERGIPQQYMIDKITQALVAAYKKDKEGYTDNVFVEVEDGDLKMYVQKEVVDDVLTPATEISLDAARKINKHAELGDLVNVDVRTQNFGRIAAQTAKQVIIQGIREAERGMIFDTFSSKEHEILTGTVLRVAPDTGDMTIRLGGNSSDRTDAMLAASEQVKGESYREGDIIRVYVVEVRRSTRGPQVIVSRTHPGLVKRLFELEVPVHMDRGVAQLHRALDDSAGSGMDAHIFGLRVFRAHAAERREPESSVCLDLCHHRAQRIRVRFEKQRIFFVRAAEVDQHAALGCQLRVKAE